MVPAVAPERLPVNPPGVDVAIYPVIVEPPLEPGAEKVTEAVVELNVEALPIFGESGTVLELITRLGAVPPYLV